MEHDRPEVIADARPQGVAPYRNRVKKLFEEMALLRSEDELDRARDILQLCSHPNAEPTARSFMADAGMSLDNREDIVAFLCLIAAHLLIDSRFGRYPYDKWTTLKKAYARIEKRPVGSAEASRLTLNRVAHRMHEQDELLRDLEPGTVRKALERAIKDALAGKTNLVKDANGKAIDLVESQKAELHGMLPGLGALLSGASY